MPVLLAYYEHIDGELVSRGQDLMELSVRQALNFTASWFLGHYEPVEWKKVLEKLEPKVDADGAPVGHSVFRPGGGVDVPTAAFDDLAALVAEAGSASPEAHSEAPT